MDINLLIPDCVFGEAYCRSLYSFIAPLKIHDALEVGFDSGSSALMFFAAQPDAELTSVDIRKDLDAAKALIEKHGFTDRHIMVEESSHVYLPTLIAKGVTYDYIYVDGDHLRNAVYADLVDCSKLLAPNGVMVVDDCVPNHGLFGVYEAVEDFLQNNSGWTKSMVPGNPNQACVLKRNG